jgi:hypothetical protein
VPDPQKPEISRPLYWPAEWAGERSFWREVAARTLAGVFTLVVIGVPALIYAGASGVLTWDRLGPILIGLALAALVVLAYVAILRVILGIERRKLAQASRTFEVSSNGQALSPEELLALVDALAHTTDAVGKQAFRWSLATTAAGVLSAFLALVVPYLWK